ncbi:MAG: serine hydrolase [Candidatus Aminicenantales bacterium]
MRFRIQRMVCLLLVGTITAGAFPGILQESGSAPPPEALEKFEQAVRDRMSIDQTPGLSVGFIRGDIAWVHAFGFSDLENRVPARPESSYRMASVTKTFTAVAVLQLCEAGKIDLDEEIQKYVPYFPRKKWPVTVRQLLGHLGGVPHYVNREKELHIKVPKTTREAIEIFKDYDLVAEPGTKYHYSSYGYNLLGAAVEQVSGQPYGDYLQEHIFKPLGMKHSRMDDPVALIPNRVRGYRLVDGKIVNSEYVDISSRFAAGGIRSTVIDLLKFARGILEGRLLRPETWRLMLTPMATKSGYFTGKGMGWTVRPWKGHFQMAHGGSQPETRTYLAIFPVDNCALALASNFESFDRQGYAALLAELALDEDFDTPPYVADGLEEAVFEACEEAFSYGLSRYLWTATPVTRDPDELRKAFAAFTEAASLQALRRDLRGTRAKLRAGIHPVSGEAFTKMASYMAAELEKAYGKPEMRRYTKKGPVAFFADYARLVHDSTEQDSGLQFSSRFLDLLGRWERDWNRTYAGDLARMTIGTDTDEAELGQRLKGTFSGASLYPDFHKDLIRVAQHHVQREDRARAVRCLLLATELYPRRPEPLVRLATLYLWDGRGEEAARLFKAAFSLEPGYIGVSIRQFLALGRTLVSAKRAEVLPSLVRIATELYPKSWVLERGLGEIYLSIRQLDKALDHYRRALRLNPKDRDIKEKVRRLEERLKK